MSKTTLETPADLLGFACPVPLQQLLANEKTLEDKVLSHLPTTHRAQKIKRCKPAGAFEKHGLAAAPAGHLAFCLIGDERTTLLSALAAAPECPVYAWTRGESYRLDASLAGFLARVHGPREPTTLARVRASLDALLPRSDAGAHPEVIERCGATFALDPSPERVDSSCLVAYGETFGALCDLHGRSLAALGETQGARAAWRQGARVGSVECLIRLARSVSEEDALADGAELLELAARLRAGKRADERASLERSSVLAHLRAGDGDAAAAVLRALLDARAHDETLIDQVRGELDAQASWSAPTRALVAPILRWFTPVRPPVSDAQRRWWSALPLSLRDALCDLTSDPAVARAGITDVLLRQVLRRETLSVEGSRHLFTDVTPLLGMERLREVHLEGPLTTLAPLASSRVERVVVNGAVIRGLRLPNPAQAKLFDALKRGDLAALERALEQGASVRVREPGSRRSCLLAARIAHPAEVAEPLLRALLRGGADPRAIEADGYDFVKHLDPASSLYAELRALPTPAPGPYCALGSGSSIALEELTGITPEQLDAALEGVAPVATGPITAAVKSRWISRGMLPVATYESQVFFHDGIAAMLRRRAPELTLVAASVGIRGKAKTRERYWLAVLPLLDALDLEASGARGEALRADAIGEIDRYVFRRELALPALFRSRGLDTVFVSRALAVALAQESVSFSELMS